MKTLLYTFGILLTSAALVSCGGSQDSDKDTNSIDAPAEKEIKLEDVSDQVKTDQEKYDSAKRALGIE